MTPDEALERVEKVFSEVDKNNSGMIDYTGIKIK